MMENETFGKESSSWLKQKQVITEKAETEWDSSVVIVHRVEMH